MKNKNIIMSDLYLEIIDYIDGIFHNYCNKNKDDTFDFDNEVSLKDIIERFSGFGYSANEIEDCYNIKREMIIAHISKIKKENQNDI
jgi:translation initiation factor IF-2